VRALLRRLALATLASAGLCLAPAGVPQTAPAGDDPVAVAIAAELESLMSPDATRIHGVTVAMQEIIQTFYGRRGFRAAWDDRKNADQLLAAIAGSEADGLDPADYQLRLLQDLTRQVRQGAATPTLRGQYDVLMTESLLRLGKHLAFGKVDAATFDAEWNYGRGIGDRDVAREVEESLTAGNLGSRLEALKPTHRLYLGLKQELARYRAASTAGIQAIPAGTPLKPGANDPRVPALRARLMASGDLGAAAGAAGAPESYDAALEAAVRQFQARMGLEADGVVGAGTVDELNVPVAERIRQLRVNLDRGRVLLQALPEEFVVVNVAGFDLYYVRGQNIAWTTRVQVGKPYRQTPIFRSEINYLVFNPTWTVPPGIIQADILPAARKDTEVFARKKLKVLDSAGREVDPRTVDWSRFRSGNIPYTLRQDPGPDNALGRVKLMFPNPYHVYLHDTPSQALFERAERSFSSGCVRVQDALKLAELALDEPGRWNKDSIAAVIAGGKLQNVTLKRKVPVLLAYWTAWVDSRGVMNFRRDIYGQDAKWAAALDERPAAAVTPASAPQ
jgi:murein L,D-transpeptidase YcbB/YkuD